MPLKVEAYLDNRGKLHQTLESAAMSDIAHEVFGSAESMAPSLAQKVLTKRAEIEAIFAAYDLAHNKETSACSIQNAPTLTATIASTVQTVKNTSDSVD